MNTPANPSTPVRLDKWLWAARFYKTRSLAKHAIDGGKVHYNSARTRPAKTVELGAEIRYRVGFEEKTVVVIAFADQRRGAPEAQLLYSETEDSIKKRTATADMRKNQSLGATAPVRRPSKKQRRDIIRFQNVNSVDHNAES